MKRRLCETALRGGKRNVSADRDRVIAARARLEAAILLLLDVRGEAAVHATPGVKHQAVTTADAALREAQKTKEHFDILIKRLP